MNATSSKSGRHLASPGIYECPVRQIDEVARGIFLMRLENEEISRSALPGQFVNVRVRNEATPLLRRPFSVCRTDPEAGTFDLLWKIHGTGTALMSTASVGDRFNILGPLGNGFSISAALKHAIVIAGGLGVAPMPMLIDKLNEMKIPATVLIGARTSAELWGEEIFQKSATPIAWATDDGSRGHHGFITTLLQETLQKNQDVEVFACGPMPMLSKVSQICREANVGAQLAVETIMGCGFGICMGCPMIPATGVKTYGRYLLACVDGPVFHAGEVALHD